MIHCLPAIWSAVPVSHIRPEYTLLTSTPIASPITRNLYSVPSTFYFIPDSNNPSPSIQYRNLDSRQGVTSVTDTPDLTYTYNTNAKSLQLGPVYMQLAYPLPINSTLPTTNLIVAPSFVSPGGLASTVSTFGYIPLLTTSIIKFYHYEDGDPTSNANNVYYTVNTSEACNLSGGIELALSIRQNRAQAYNAIGFRLTLNLPYSGSGILDTTVFPIRLYYSKWLDLGGPGIPGEIVYVRFNGVQHDVTSIPYGHLLSEVYGDSTTRFILQVQPTTVNLRVIDSIGRAFTLLSFVNDSGSSLPYDVTGCSVSIDNIFSNDGGYSCPYDVLGLDLNRAIPYWIG